MTGEVMEVRCPYCGGLAKSLSGAELYCNRPDLAAKWFWQCKPCNAHVGCHPGTKMPLGSLANYPLRSMRSAAHRAFDPLWRAKAKKDGISYGEARRLAYGWLAEQMDMTRDECHIGMMNIDQCKRVIWICQDHTPTKRAKSSGLYGR